jgi:AGZA family xanthine/uracil permease-like MFS transporter
MFFSPLAAAIPEYATAPALILIGVLIAQSMGKVEWGDFTEAPPAFLTMIAMPLTFSIATGLSFGLISYTVIKIATGRARDVNAFVWITTVVFLARYVYLAQH